MWFCFREIRLHIVVHHSKRHFHGNLTAGKFGISGQRETSACPGPKNEPAFQQARLMEPFSLQCSVSIRCTLRQKFLRLFFVLQFGWYSYSTTGCSTSLRSGTAAYVCPNPHLCGDHDSCPPDFSANPLHGRSGAYTPRFRKPVLHHLNSDIFGRKLLHL